ncbi:Kinase, NEK [Giardia lamblia P15]|uniref:non-specific serine/threonine protein kinase n=1 Tax=Giardia intestinalis (strain P15) TaxID=658858 RepID=E1EYN9_GIAIA|nr:Kinase, NEK [Giardia lamblia P15]
MVSESPAHAAESAGIGPDGVPIFSLAELYQREGEMLGKGAFGAVRAIEGYPELAVKEVMIKNDDAKFMELTEHELKTVKRLSHPGVIKYHQAIRDESHIFIIMYRYHWDLQRLITAHRRTNKPVPKGLAFSILEQVADALAYLHNPYKMAADGSSSHGVVYRDLKPANTLMTRDGQRVVLADFGLCKDALHNGGTFAGTPAYMAPETFIRHETSTASDIWAFGVVMYELATMKLPSFSHFWKPEDAKAFFVSGWRPDLRAIEDDFVRTVLEKIFVLDPAERPTARQLCELLREFNASPTGMKLRISALESALEDANTRNASLEKAL